MTNSGLLVGLFTLAGVLVGGGVQLALSMWTHRQQMRDDRRARTRGYFAKVYGAAYVFLIFSQTKAMIPHQMTQSSNQLAELDKFSWGELRKTDTETQEAIAILALEGGNDEIIDAYLRIKTALANYMNNPGDDNSEVVECFNNLRNLMKGKYHELEKVT